MIITLLLLYNLHRFRVLSKGVAGGYIYELKFLGNTKAPSNA
jgi:hypothetical protein